jgi:biotin carboxylase
VTRVKRKIGVLGANKPLINFYKRARELGCEIHSFAWEDGAVCKSLADYFYPISFTETDKIVQICKEENIEMVTSFSLESALPYVYDIAQKMGWECPSQKSRALCANKLTMRKEFGRQGVSIPFFIDTNDVHHQADAFPVIVKPIDSGGSRGVTKVDNPKDLPKAIERAIAFSANQRVLIEQFIDGPEFSVEAISHLGSHYIVAITEKVTSGAPNFVELAHFQPALIAEESSQKIRELVTKALDVLMHEEGPSHTEVRFDQNGDCFVIEVGTRLGGDFITSDLVRLSTGYDLVEASIALACGHFIAPQVKLQQFSGVYFKSPETKLMWDNIDIWKTKEFYVESEEWFNESKVITESADRMGYLIYQHHERLKLNGTF